MNSLKHQVGGFTLIELMIVVAVVAILAAIAYPSYQDAVRKSRRGQAKADLVEYVQLAERFHTTQNTYFGFALPVTKSPRETSATAYYNLTLTTSAATPNTFTITATPQTAGGQNRDTCGTLTINQANVRTAGGASNPNCF
ncbi:type IV pilin protein [Pseudoxanthomonas sp. GM95]|uniref:type IV pilin protein n=1 Tax=Pseudoxanthomonas sp. GM95 TaxID=1881043 RepID=UPI000B8135CE|nr:type IV pilin protein [Pseudoxanthomonas sp. GM95]